MNTFIIFIILMPIVGFALLAVNMLLAVYKPYNEKLGAFECGLTSFNQTRLAFNAAFILVAMLFTPFDLEMSTLLPYVMSIYLVSNYGFTMVLMFLLMLIMGFVYEINTNALKINKHNKPNTDSLIYKL
uniref:NADH-ubiquinone oxidoreductase chain 3 n=1 Tax=Yarrowia deformans TaxID=1608523 RepID=G4U4Z5_9ASCO|nr:NADH dehydrogenase subunit 3 [Yarrowia deformans]CCC29047.1 subunit ND3 of proton translocating NADH:ubiquinone oxidoreductase [Yarrowia deformans]